MESKLLHGGENLLEKAEKQKSELDRLEAEQASARFAQPQWLSGGGLGSEKGCIGMIDGPNFPAEARLGRLTKVLASASIPL